MPEPHPRQAGTPPEHAPCPFCEGTDTKLINPFGGQLSMAQYWCNRCRTGFEYIKWEEAEGDPPPSL
jgi:C4-type Zn-finger protein